MQTAKNIFRSFESVHGFLILITVGATPAAALDSQVSLLCQYKKSNYPETHALKSLFFAPQKFSCLADDSEPVVYE